MDVKAILEAAQKATGISVSLPKLQEFVESYEAGKKAHSGARKERQALAVEAAKKALNQNRNSIGIRPSDVLVVILDSSGNVNARILADTDVNCAMAFARRDPLAESLATGEENAVKWAKLAYPNKTPKEVHAILAAHNTKTGKKTKPASKQGAAAENKK